MQFGEKLKQLRASKGVSQAELAENIFVSRSAVAKWENGLGLPSDESLKFIADYFGVTASELLSDPITENVIVTKNSALSKQKILIVALSALVSVALIIVAVLSVLFSNKPEPIVPPEPVITRELILETEKDLDTHSIVNYPDDEISADKTFADSRVFALEHEKSEIYLPKLLVKVTVDDIVHYEEVIYANIVTTCSDNISVNYDDKGLYVRANNYYIEEFVDYVNIKYGELFLSVKVFRHHISVEKATVGFIDNTATIGLTKSKKLDCIIEPSNASYKHYTYTIEQITRPNGEIYNGELSDYATIENSYLTATERIEIGSTIYISATTDYDKVRSNMFAVIVERVAIEKLDFGSSSNFLKVDESRLLTLSASPQDASFNVLGEQATVTLVTPELATLEKTEDGYLITASNEYNAVGKEVLVTVETPEGVSETFSWYITGINVESIILLNVETGEEVDEVIYMRRNSTMQFSVAVAPINATYDKVHYGVVAYVNNFGRYVTMSEDGLLTLSSSVPFDLEIYISASAGKAHSKAYRIIVEKVSVESVTLSCDVADKIPIRQVVSFSVTLSPIDADEKSAKYFFVNDVEGVYLSGNLLLVSADAVVGTQFQVYAIVDGIQSNILTFTVVASTE